MKLQYKKFESGTKSWKTMCDEVVTFVNGLVRVNGIPPAQIMNISIGENGPPIGANGIIVVWYWVED